MTGSAKRLAAAAVITVLTAVASNLSAAVIIRNIADITAVFDDSGILYSRLIQLKTASIMPSWIFPLIFGIIIGVAAVTAHGGRLTPKAVIVIFFCAAGAVISAIWYMSVNSVPFGSFLTILLRYIRGGLLDAL